MHPPHSATRLNLVLTFQANQPTWQMSAVPLFPKVGGSAPVSAAQSLCGQVHDIILGVAQHPNHHKDDASACFFHRMLFATFPGPGTVAATPCQNQRPEDGKGSPGRIHQRKPPVGWFVGIIPFLFGCCSIGTWGTPKGSHKRWDHSRMPCLSHQQVIADSEECPCYNQSSAKLSQTQHEI